MNILKSISQNNERIPLEYRQTKSFEEIKADLEGLDWENVLNKHLFNLRALIVPKTKKITKIEAVSGADTGDLEIEDISHSYWVNGIPTHNTVNLPNDYPYNDFKNLYMTGWENNIKGLTTYRAGTMIAVLEKKKEIKKYQSELERMFTEANGNVIKENVKIPTEYFSKGYVVKDKNKKKWYFNVAFADSSCRKPFALFITTNGRAKGEVAENVVEAIENLIRQNKISDELIKKQSVKYIGENNINKVARSISMALRHNISIIDIVNVLDNCHDGFATVLFATKKILSNFIEDGAKAKGEKCPDCGKATIIYQEGCKSCKNCGWSACG